MATIKVQAEDFDAAAEAAALTRGRADIGAVVTFVGLCRDEGGALSRLEIEHYPGMAEEELARVAEEAEARWPLLGVAIIHRFGAIAPGEQIVLVVDRLGPSRRRLRGGRLSDGLSQNARAVLEAGAPRRRLRRRLGRSEVDRRHSGGAMARRRDDDERPVGSGSGDDEAIDDQDDDRADDGDHNALDIDARLPSRCRPRLKM